MILEFIPYEDTDAVLTSVFDAACAPVKGDTVYIQTEPGKPFTEYRVDNVAWQVDARSNFSAIVTVRQPSGFGD